METTDRTVSPVSGIAHLQLLGGRRGSSLFRAAIFPMHLTSCECGVILTGLDGRTKDASRGDLDYSSRAFGWEVT